MSHMNESCHKTHLAAQFVCSWHCAAAFDLQVVSSVLQCVAVCCCVLQCVAVCCCVLQCVAVCLQHIATRSNILRHTAAWNTAAIFACSHVHVSQYTAVCRSMLQYAVCLQHIATCSNTLQHITTHCSTRECVADAYAAMCCSVLQCVAVYLRVAGTLQHIATRAATRCNTLQQNKV